MTRRPAATLVEVVVVVGLLAVMASLLLPAVQKVRQSAGRSASLNNLRQLTLATHQVAASFDGFIGGVHTANPPTLKECNRLNDLHPMLASPLGLAYLTMNGRRLVGGESGPVAEGVQPLMVSPGDPSVELRWSPALTNATHWYGGPTSYAFNMAAFVGPVKFPAGIPDGLSNTVAYCERYYARHGPVETTRPDPRTGDPMPYRPTSLLNFAYTDSTCGRTPYGKRRASFADPGWGDVVPVTDPATRTTRPSRPGATFQVQPAAQDADLQLPQTPFAAGLPVALFDGSVRTVRPGVSPETFWAAVTPAGGEVVSLD